MDKETIKRAREEVLKNMQKFSAKIEELEDNLQEHYKAMEQCKGALEVLRAQEAGIFDAKPEETPEPPKEVA